MIPTPTETGIWPWRKVHPCYCMARNELNPHGWVRGYCPPKPAPRRPTPTK